MRSEVLQVVHDHLAHGGQERTYLAMRSRFHWKNMYADCVQYVRSCLVCQQSKRPQVGTKATFHPVPVTDIFDRWHLDFAGPLPVTANGCKHILMCVDSLSKWPELIAVADQSATTVAKALYDNVSSRFEPPRSIFSDRGTAFLSQIVADLCKPQTNATVERVWRVLWAALRAHCVDQTDWEEKLTSIAYALRSTPSASSKFSPAMILYGREMTLPLQSALLPTATGRMNVDGCVKQLLPRLRLTRQVALDNIKEAQTVYKKYYDQKSHPKVYAPGDMVWLHSSYNPKGVCPKLRRKYEGPFVVASCEGNDTYRLRDATNGKAMASAVHVKKLRPYLMGRETLTERYREVMGQETTDDQDEDHDADDLVDSSPPAGSFAMPSSAPVLVSDPTTDNVVALPNDETISAPLPTSQSLDSNASNTPTSSPNDISQQPSTSATVDPGTDLPVGSQVWFPVDRLLKCKVQNGRRFYLVQWTGGTWPNS